ncbi:MAG: PQQ-binding-like beta-propeller repeat protein [Planctomycetota bacterium]
MISSTLSILGDNIQSAALLPGVVPLEPPSAWSVRVTLLIALGVISGLLLLIVIGWSRSATRLQELFRDHLLPRIVPLTLLAVALTSFAVWQAGRITGPRAKRGNSPPPAAPPAPAPTTTPTTTATAASGAATATVGAGKTPVADWTMERGGQQRLGIAPGAIGPQNDRRHWQRLQDDEAYYSSPTVIGDRLYAVASVGDRARILCLAAHTGQEIWNTAPADYRATFSSPVIADEQLFVGEGLHQTRRGRLVAVDLRAGAEGQIRWTFPTSGHIECTPTVAHGRVYFGAGDDGIYCLKIPTLPALPAAAAQTAAAKSSSRVPPSRSTPQVVFHLPGAQFPDAETALAVHEGRLYVGLGVGGNALCVFHADTGQLLERIALPYPVFSPPAFDETHLYVGLGDANYANPAMKVPGQVIGVNQKTLAIDWTIDLPGAVLGAVAVDQEELFWACGNGFIYRLNLRSRALDHYDTRAPLAASLAVTATTVFAANQAGQLLALDRATWKLQFEHSLGSPGNYVSSPTIFGRHLVIGTPNAGLICIGP